MVALLDHPIVCVVAIVCAYLAVIGVSAHWSKTFSLPFLRAMAVPLVRRMVREELAAIRAEEAAAQRAHLDADMQAMKERS